VAAKAREDSINAPIIAINNFTEISPQVIFDILPGKVLL
jgi:hypothetical protein